MNKCTVCHGTEFYTEAGYYFCIECHTQKEDQREEILELRLDATRITKRKIRREKSEKIDHSLQWTTWEQYNCILIGLVEELIELGVTSELKLTVLQLWAYYLGKIEVAFTSTKKKKLPKLARSFHKKDADIIYGKLEARKRKRRKATSNSSVVSSQVSEGSSVRELNKYKRLMFKEEYNRFENSQNSESDVHSFVSQSLHSVRSVDSQSSIIKEKLRYSKHAKTEMKKVYELSKKLPMAQRFHYRLKHVTTNYRIGPYVITPMKLWSILYLALRIHKQDIHLADMLRYGREGHLSYYRLDHLLPAEMVLSNSDVKLLTQNIEITHKGMRRTCAEIAKSLFITKISCPDLMSLITRYCKELNLPQRISTHAGKLIGLSPPRMTFSNKESMIPNYEGRAMAFIIVVLKLLFGIDGITEYNTSRIADRINKKTIAEGGLRSKLFSFREWQRYMECRRNLLMSKHFPTKFKYDSDGFGDTELYVKFINSALSRREEKPEFETYKNYIPRDLSNAMKQCVTMLTDSDTNVGSIEIFPPSLTPQYSYLEQLLEHPMYDLPDILRNDFSASEIYYSTKPKKFIKSVAEYGIQLEIVRSRLHFLYKVVPQFDKPKMPSVGKWNEPVTILNQNEDKCKCTPSYLKKNGLHKFILSAANQLRYDAIQERLRADQKNKTVDGEGTSSMRYKTENCYSGDSDFSFEDVTCDGKLAIPPFQNSECDTKPILKLGDNSEMENKLHSLNFYEKYNIDYPDCCIVNDGEIVNEMNAQVLLKIDKSIGLGRDANGRFLKHNSSDESIVNSIKNDAPVNRDEFLNSNSSEKLFVTSEDYWMYHCLFGRVKPKNFESFESELPVSFQWLLNECADIVEMSTEDLYEQVCTVETHLAYVLRPNDLENKSPTVKVNPKKIKICERKW